MKSPTVESTPSTPEASRSHGAGLRLVDLDKHYGDVAAVQGLSLDVEPGEFITLLGPSGSGKSTTLGMIAGFERPTSGRIWIDDQDITPIPTHKRNLGMVFQGYALFPHLSVFDNVAFPLTLRGVHGRALRDAVGEALEIVSLSDLGHRRPRELSGGQQQRVALARGFVHRPPVLLMDEPLSALDRALRQQMQVELRRIHQEIGTTVVYVTHDQEEALGLSDRVVVMSDSRLAQCGTPQEIYERPASRFVASFVGTANFLPVSNVRRTDDGRWHEAVTADGTVIRGYADKAADGADGVVLLRPEDASTTATPAEPVNALTVRPMEVIYLGDRIRCIGTFGDGARCAFWLNHSQASDIRIGADTQLTWPVERTVLLAD
ncbi:MAG: ABC transporter ATP-binding protein [Nocardioidaceae bacterium]